MPPTDDVSDLHGECEGFPLPHELGNWIEFLLKFIGITKARWAWLAGHRPKEGCVPCNQRQESANTLGLRLKAAFKGQLMSWGAWLSVFTK